MKKRFRRMCRAFVAAGKSSRDYLLLLGAPERSIFIAPDAVDVRFFSQLADNAREHAMDVRVRYGLPARYFLCVGRLVREKGVLDLLAAYAELDEGMRSQIGLVFAGDGPLRAELMGRAAQIRQGDIKFCGWLDREQIPDIYAGAEALVFPTHSDPWGLVVNEGMACGLPIIASDVAGCVPDLVKNEGNGFVVPPRDTGRLAWAMQAIFSQPELASRMRTCSLARVQAHTPEACAEGLVKAATFACDGVA